MTYSFSYFLWIISKICVFHFKDICSMEVTVFDDKLVLPDWTFLSRLPEFSRFIINICNFYYYNIIGCKLLILVTKFIHLKNWKNMKWNLHLLVTFFYRFCIIYNQLLWLVYWIFEKKYLSSISVIFAENEKYWYWLYIHLLLVIKW